jgi:hypothetical protein
MYSFEELCSRKDYPFTYLLGVLRKMPREAELTADFFTGEFSWIQTREEQSDTAKKTISGVSLFKKFVTPTAPLTMTPSWSPFPFAFDMLPHLVARGKNEKKDASAFAIWEPELVSTGQSELRANGKLIATFENYVTESDVDFGGDVNAFHFFWLLQMTVERAKNMKGKVLLAGQPGWSYDSELKHPTAPHSRLRLLEAGYLYPERIPYAARLQYQQAQRSKGSAEPDEAQG